MTENEIIEILQTEKACVTRAMKNECNRDCYNCDLCEEGKDILTVYDAVIKALEEREQYQAIGTVEELKTAMLYVSLAKKHGTVGRAIDACAEYESIGTIDEFKALKEENKFLEFLYDRILPNEMEQYLSMYNATDIKGNTET